MDVIEYALVLCRKTCFQYQSSVSSVVIGAEFGREDHIVLSSVTIIGRELKPLDIRNNLQSRLNGLWKQKKFNKHKIVSFSFQTSLPLFFFKQVCFFFWFFSQANQTTSFGFSIKKKRKMLKGTTIVVTRAWLTFFFYFI
jgi:hypothetical protein